MMTSFVESISKNEIAKSVLDYIVSIKEKTSDLYKSSTFFRITSIITGSVIASYVTRNIYVKYYRKYKNLPPGTYGMPFVGDTLNFLNVRWIGSLNKYGCVLTISLGPMDVVLLNDPYLIKKIYSDSRTLDVSNTFIDSDVMFISTNGAEWEKRRKIVYANLMSTMKASFVEDASKAFITNKVFPVFNEKLKQNEAVSLKPLMRPLGFNIVLQACFGTELESLDDPLLKRFDQINQEMRNSQAMLQIILMITGGIGRVSNAITGMLGIKSFDYSFQKMTDLLEAHATNEDNKVKRDESNKDIKLFDDYIEQYAEDDTLTKKKLYGDMTLMFAAALDTTYSALAFGMILAAKNQSIQDELYKELTDAFGDDINNITLSKGGILKIPKLRAFIHEVLRIYPPGTLGGFREMKSKGFKIDTRKFGDNHVYDVPVGKNLMFNIYGVHHNPKWWVKDYDPIKHKDFDMNDVHLEFWLDSNGKFNKQQNSTLFLTFSRGKRDCVGQSLAMKEIYIVLAMIFMTYTISGPNGDDNFKINASLSQGNILEPESDQITLKLR